MYVCEKRSKHKKIPSLPLGLVVVIKVVVLHVQNIPTHTLVGRLVAVGGGGTPLIEE